MRAPSKRVTFVVAFLVANFLLFFPFASEAHEELPGQETPEEEPGIPEDSVGPGETEIPDAAESRADESPEERDGDGEAR